MIDLKKGILNHEMKELPLIENSKRVVLKLKARTKQLCNVLVKNDLSLETGYLPKIQSEPGVNLGGALIEPINGIARIFCINCTNEDVELVVPPIELEDYTEVIPGPRSRTNDKGSTKETQHNIDTTDNIPVNSKYPRYPEIHKKEIKKQTNDLLANESISVSKSPYNSPV